MIKSLVSIEKEFSMEEVDKANPDWVKYVMIGFVGFIFLTAILFGCVGNNPAVQPKTINMKIEGNVSQVTVVEEHPCKDNWNFCDYIEKE